MKIIKILIGISILLIGVYAIVEYIGHVNLAHPVDAIVLSFLLMILIVFFLESKKFGYFIVLIVSYSILIPIFSMEVLLFNELENNQQWFKERYSYRGFKIEFYLFLPIILLFYFLFFSYGKSSKTFSIKGILLKMKEVLIDE